MRTSIYASGRFRLVEVAEGGGGRRIGSVFGSGEGLPPPPHQPPENDDPDEPVPIDEPPGPIPVPPEPGPPPMHVSLSLAF